MSHATFVAAVLAGVAALAGCRGEEARPRVHVQGEVTYNGQPVPYGRVLFEPRGDSGPQGYALIEAGRYTTRKHGQPCIGGPHEVVISGFDGQSVNDDAPYGRLLFPPHREQRNITFDSAPQSFHLGVR